MTAAVNMPAFTVTMPAAISFMSGPGLDLAGKP